MRKLVVAMAIVALLAPTVQAKGPTEADFEKIVKAAPDKATAKPAKPRKLLVFSLTRSYRHASIPCGVKAIEAMGAKTGAFTTIVSNDIAMFEPEKIKQFDAIVMNNTTGELFLPKNFKKLPADKKASAEAYDKKLKKSLKDFVSGGKGLAVIHGGLWCFLNSWHKEYSDMCGAAFVAHPWHTKVSIKIDDPENPICAAFGGKGFEVYDEIYAFTKPYDRASQRVLYSLDTSKMKLKPKFRGKRDDGDYALGWIKSYGKGRVFYTALGHYYPIFYNPAILKHWLDGIQYALGYLKADATGRPLKASAAATKNTEKKKIVLIAGTGSHGKTAHAHAAGVDLFKKYLDAAGKDKGIETLVIKNNWPADPSVLNGADTIVVYSDGWGGHALMDKEKKRVEKIRKLMAAGCGLICIHYAVCPPLGNDSAAGQRQRFPEVDRRILRKKLFKEPTQQRRGRSGRPQAPALPRMETFHDHRRILLQDPLRQGRQTPDPRDDDHAAKEQTRAGSHRLGRPARRRRARVRFHRWTLPPQLGDRRLPQNDPQRNLVDRQNRNTPRRRALPLRRLQRGVS